MKMQLVPNWRKLWRMWTVRLNAVGIALLSWLYFDPSVLLFFLNALPDELQSVLPTNIMLGLSILIYGAAIVARLVHQEKIHEK